MAIRVNNSLILILKSDMNGQFVRSVNWQDRTVTLSTDPESWDPDKEGGPGGTVVSLGESDIRVLRDFLSRALGE